ncbi:WecB/TagA/CpsF family glycosyltransferase [Candidatus Saganbacteria bacterium]|nr:WecB/TagA/CpsF family glycosyltransferase [Candidatus Saganbacteria bacterium]
MIEQIKLADVIVDNVTMAEALDKLQELIASKVPSIIVTPNPEIIVSSQNDPELKAIINNADLRLPDGISMVVVSKILGSPLKERVSGIDFLLASCKLAENRGWSIYLLGSSETVVKKTAENLQVQFPKLKIAGYHNGFFNTKEEESSIITSIANIKPTIVFVGLGAGRQERWLAKNMKGIGSSTALGVNSGVGIGVGGSFDVISGLKKRAPVIYQKLYIEWLYRLITEPQRWKRQLALPRFLWLTLIKR